MKRASLSLFVSILILTASSAQEKINNQTALQFNGVILDGSSLKPLPNVQISVNRRYASVSGGDGRFALYVERKDSVKFSMLGYKEELMYISDTLKGDEYIAGIYMKDDTLAIGEVVIIPRYRNIRSEILNTPNPNAAIIENARYNVAISAYQGKTTIGSLGDPASNYEMLRSRQKMYAYSAGQIPPDQMVALSPLILIPAVYLLVKGLPEKPPAYSPGLTDPELKAIEQEYFRSLRDREQK